MSDHDETRNKLKKLRDRLAQESSRANVRANAPPPLRQRLQAALEMVTATYNLALAKRDAPQTIEEVCEDAVVEAHVALNDWERFLEREEEQLRRRRTMTPPPDRRAHTRHETSVSVKLLRHAVHGSGTTGVELRSETVARPARNISMSGIFVTLARQDLPDVNAGGVVHIEVRTAGEPPLNFRARAVVARRDDQGIGLRWVEDSEMVRRSIESLLDAVRRTRG